MQTRTPLSSPSSTQNGSVIFYILIAIAVLAALTIAIGSSMRGGTTSSMSEQKVNLLASDIMATGDRLSEAVTRLRIKGVTTTQLSFENLIVTGYTNANCSVGTCKVFDQTGGGLTWETPPVDAQPGTALDWAFSAAKAWTAVGTAPGNGELIAFLPGLSLDICNQINKQLGITAASPPSFALTNTNKFTGSYASTGTVNNASVNGKTSGCVQITALSGTIVPSLQTNTYTYYQVLLPQ